MALYLVATPIGNLDDLSARALKVLKDVHVIASEDTRHTQKLLSHYGIRQALIRYDEHVHGREAPRILERLKRGEDVALVSDAGTPGVSDPGSRLVEMAVARGIQIVPIPGPSAVLASLVASGLPTDQFVFLGFLSRRPGRIKKELQEVGNQRTIVFFESVYRIKSTLKVVKEAFGDIPVSVGREITKVYEEFIRGPLSEVIEKLDAQKELKGEFAVVVGPTKKKKKTDD